MKSPLTNDGLTLTDAEFRMFADLIREHVGLDFNESSRFLLERRLSRRIRELELGSVAAYHYHIRNGSSASDEFPNLIDELTTNETYFFREYSQLRALIDEIIEELQLDREKRGGRPINIWSAGCSSGEEPYSVAMLAREAGLKPGSDVHVYASDISRRMLRKARKGIYREASFRGTDPHLRDKYFIEKDRLWQISDDLKRDVDFIHLNLLDNSKIALLRTMDVILCRNVIIYFNIDTKCQVIRTFYEKLRPGGHLLLGHSESLINLSTSFELRHLRRDLVYRRPLPGMAAEDPWSVAAAAAISRSDHNGIDE
ncbi:MAG: protein-glutamate O-methyltransferase CheR [Deltaproteobacteria bacterium]|nr:protein-glutamate O-methyltransferase CheR [Deltaproteobacteria bacterium]